VHFDGGNTYFMANAGLLLARMKKNISTCSSKISIRYRSVTRDEEAVVYSLRVDRIKSGVQSECTKEENKTDRACCSGPSILNQGICASADWRRSKTRNLREIA